MADGTQLIQSLYETVEQANDAIEMMVPNAVAKAEAEAAYHAVLADTVQLLRENGTPVSIVNTLAKGNSLVGALWVAFCREEAKYDATRETIMLRKKEIDVIREVIQREWGAAK